jgi:hypothetical protein
MTLKGGMSLINYTLFIWFIYRNHNKRSDTGRKMMHRGMMGRRFALFLYCPSSNLIEAQTCLIFTTVPLLSGTEIFSDFYLTFMLEFGIVYCYCSLLHSSIISLDHGLYDAT